MYRNSKSSVMEERQRNRSNRTRRAIRTSSNNHIVIEVSEDGHVQVIQSLRSLSSSEQTSLFTRNYIPAPPLHPTVFDGTYRLEDDEDTNSEWTVSSESIPSEESDSEMALEEVVSTAVSSVPVIEPGASGEGMEVRKKSISVVGNVRGQAVGTMIDPDSTVLMQLSRGSLGGYNEILEYMGEVNEMLNDQTSTVILKYPGLEDSQRSRAGQLGHVETAKNMMELTEDVLRRVQGSSRESILIKLQNTLGEMLYQPEDTIAIHTFSREDTGCPKSEALVAYFRKDNDAALFVQVPESSNGASKSLSGCEDDERVGVERLKSLLQESLHSQERILGQTLGTEPEITISRSGNNVIGVLSFPNSSSAVVKTNVDNFSVEQDRSEMVRSMKDLLQNLVQQSSGKLLVQMHADSDRETIVDQIKSELDQSIRSGTAESGESAISVKESDDKVIGVLNYSGGSIVIQTSSKNWIHAQSCSDPKDLLASIRLLIELFIMSSELTDVDLQSLASIIVQAFHCPRVELSDEYCEKYVLEKMKFVVHRLMNPEANEDPLLIINQLRSALEDIADPELATCHSKEPYSTDVLINYLDELICEENSQYTDDQILRTLRGALLDILIHYDTSLSGALEELLGVLKNVSAENIELHAPPSVTSSPGVTAITNDPFLLERFSSDHPSREMVQRIHNLLGDEEPSEGREVSYLTTFHTLFLTLLRIIGGWSFRVKSFLGKEPAPAISAEPESESTLEPEPGISVQRKPSVSFHLLKQPDEADERTPSDISQQLEDERQKLNSAIDDLRQFLEESLNVPESWDQQRKGSLMQFSSGRAAVKQRMLHLFSKLLDEAGKLKVTDKSRDSIHLRLDSASGELERKEGAQYVVLSGNVRDRQHNLGLFFEARMMDLEGVSKVESEVECVTEVRRLSDESEQLVTSEIVPEVVNSCVADFGSEREGEVERAGDQEEFRLQETLSRYFELIQSYIQETMDPMRETLGVILEKIAVAGTEKIREIRSSFIQTSGNMEENYVVELQDSQEATAEEQTEVLQHAKSIQCVGSVAKRSVQQLERLSDHPSRLDNIESTLRELKQQMTELCDLLRNPVPQPVPMGPQYLDPIPSPPTSPLPSVQSSSSDSSTSFVSVAPTAPPLEEIDGRLSVLVEIVSLEEKHRLSQASSGKSVVQDHQFVSAVECPTGVESRRESDGTTDAQDRFASAVECPERLFEEKTARSSELVPAQDLCVVVLEEEQTRENVPEQPRSSEVRFEELPRRSTASQTVEYRGTQTDPEILPETVETAVQAVESKETDVPVVQVHEETSEQRESIFSQIQKRLSSLVTTTDAEPIAEDSQKRRSTRVSIVEPVTVESSEDDQTMGSLELDDATRSYTVVSTTDTPESTIPSMELERPSIESNGSDVEQVVQPQEYQRRSTSASIVDPVISLSDSGEQPEQGSKQPLKRRSTSVVSKDSQQLSEEQFRRSKVPHRQEETLQVNEIPVRDNRNPMLCDVVLSYQCRHADELGRRYVSPVEIISCHPVGANQLMVHWEVAPQFVDQISGFEIYVDGEANMFYYSNRRRTSLLEDIDTQRQHRIVIYCNPKSWIGKAAQWAPAVFFYHL
ncbi:uncharacterized protein LOC109401734 isoform X2 [Aedes albopictus]|uniref:Uncharacterized protein n=1 Tax=Aedes albopictus TaxID=7160 RepID=A0ABM1ZJ56_AEDAL